MEKEPESFMDYIDHIDACMMDMWGIDTTDAGIEMDNLAQAQENGEKPEEYAKWYGQKYDLTPRSAFTFEDAHLVIAKYVKPEELDFLKIERDCLRNKNVQPGERLIYDYSVIINGENRATLSAYYGGRGYTLQRLDGGPIHTEAQNKGRWGSPMIGAKVEKKADFVAFIRERLAENVIPTLADYRLSAEIALARNQAETENMRRDQYVRQVKEAALDLLFAAQLGADALELLEIDYRKTGDLKNHAVVVGKLAIVRKVINKAEGK